MRQFEQEIASLVEAAKRIVEKCNEMQHQRDINDLLTAVLAASIATEVASEQIDALEEKVRRQIVEDVFSNLI